MSPQKESTPTQNNKVSSETPSSQNASPKKASVKLGPLKEPIFVSGAGGFIGRRLLQRLLEQGKSVVAFDIVPCPESLESIDVLRWVQGDITSSGDVRSAIQGCKTVFHLAAMVGDWGAEALHQAVTVDGTEHVFQAAIESELEPAVILASSIVIYGDKIAQGICDEGVSAGSTFGPYSQCKQAQEQLAQQYLQRGLDVRIVRPANVYGAGSKPWVEDLCKELLKGTPCLVGGGQYDAGLVHVENVVEVLVRVARSRQARGQVYNAADENGVTWKQYLSDMASLCGAEKPKSIPRVVAQGLALALERSFRLLRIETRPPMTLEALNLIGSAHQISMSKARRELGYKPVVSYEAGLSEVAEYIAPGAL